MVIEPSSKRRVSIFFGLTVKSMPRFMFISGRTICTYPFTVSKFTLELTIRCSTVAVATVLLVWKCCQSFNKALILFEVLSRMLCRNLYEGDPDEASTLRERYVPTTFAIEVEVFILLNGYHRFIACVEGARLQCSHGYYCLCQKCHCICLN